MKKQITATQRGIVAVAAACLALSTVATVAAEPTRVKMSVQSDGLYSVSAAQMASCLSVSESTAQGWIASGNISMSHGGRDMAWMASASDDAVLFYGEGIDSIYTRDNIYWLDGGQAGTMISGLSGSAPVPASSSLAFRETLTFSEQNWAAPTYFYNQDDDIWVWAYAVAGSGPVPFAVDLPTPSSAGSASIDVRLLGISDTAANPDHHAKIYVNGTFVGETTWDGMGRQTASASFSQSLLQDGANTVSVEAVLGVGVGYSYFYIDDITVSYDRTHRAVNNAIIVHDDVNSTVAADGFTTDDAIVLDVTDPNAARQLQGITRHGVAGDYAVSFNVVGASSRYIAVVPSAAQAPASIVADTTPDLLDAGNAADYIVIAPQSLAASAQMLVDHRASQGLAAMLIDIEDVYDAFNDGVKDAWAIHSLVAYTHANWQTAPAYIVLAGEGSYDFMNYKGNNDSLIPTALVHTSDGLSVSDTRLGDVDGGGVPEAVIGRLPVKTAAELDAMIAKIQAYETGGSWKDTVSFVADDPDGGGAFTDLSNTAATMLPGTVQTETLYLEQQSLANVRAGLVAAANAGRSLVNYIGHGMVDKLADEGILRQTEINQMTASDRAPIFLSMACDSGNFGLPGYDVPAELLLKAAGGACGVWAASGSTFTPESALFNDAFLSHVYNAEFARAGDGIVVGLTARRDNGHMPFMSFIYNFIGDPATIIVGSAQSPAPAYDFGDATAGIYPTAESADGARHIVVPGCHLGVAVDGETNACASGSAVGDDLDGSDDEDGVEFLTGIIPGAQTLVNVTASMPGILNAWVDFNGDGDWSDAGEAIFVDQPVVSGVNALQFGVPSSIVRGVIYFRFRFSTASGLAPTGTAPDGEVEDYALELTATYAVLSDISAVERDGLTAVRWETSMEIGTIGFMLERLGDNGIYHRVTADIVPAILGGPYEVIDSAVPAGETATYRIIEIENDGDRNLLGPYELTAATAYASWQSEHFSDEELAVSAIADDNADADNDGHSNLQEFLAGTDPRNAGSVLRLTSLRSVQSGVELTWNSVAGKAYRIEYAASMTSEFSEIAEVSSNGDATTFVHDASGRGCYRVTLSL